MSDNYQSVSNDLAIYLLTKDCRNMADFLSSRHKRTRRTIRGEYYKMFKDQSDSYRNTGKLSSSERDLLHDQWWEFIENVFEAVDELLEYESDTSFFDLLTTR